MEKVSQSLLKDIFLEANKPIKFKELALLAKIEANELDSFENFIKSFASTMDLDIKEFPEENCKEDNRRITIKLIEKPDTTQKNKFFEMKDDELNKTYQRMIMKLNKLKDEKKKISESEMKKKYIKVVHEYNALKDSCQDVLGKLALIQNKTINEIHEDYGLQQND